MKKILVCLVVILQLTACNDEVLQQKAEVFYVPIFAETYVPVTAATIEKTALRYGKINRRNPEFRRVLNIIEKYPVTQNAFDPHVVRVKILFQNSDLILIDRDGGVKEDSKEKKLSNYDLKIVNGLLRRLAECHPDLGVDCRLWEAQHARQYFKPRG